MPDDGVLIDDLRRRVASAPRRPIGPFDRAATHPPARPEDIASAEADLGFRLPPLLRRVYAEVADGGLGPGYGLFPVLRGRDEPGQDECLVDVRAKLAVDPRWHPRLLPLCDWGCAIWSWLDCRTEDGFVVTVAGEAPFMAMPYNLRAWFQAWLNGVDLWDERFEPGPAFTGINPFTKKPIEMKGQGKPKGDPWT